MVHNLGPEDDKEGEKLDCILDELRSLVSLDLDFSLKVSNLLSVLEPAE